MCPELTSPTLRMRYCLLMWPHAVYLCFSPTSHPVLASSQYHRASLFSAAASLPSKRKLALNPDLTQISEPPANPGATCLWLLSGCRQPAFLTPRHLPPSNKGPLLCYTQTLLPPILPYPGCPPRALRQYLQQGQVCILGQLLQVLHSRCGLDHTHQGWGAVEWELAQQGLLVTEQQQGMVRAVEQSPVRGHVRHRSPAPGVHLEHKVQLGPRH